LSRVGVIAALPAEAACLTGCSITPDEPYRINDNLVVLVSGTGSARARTSAAKLLEFNVQALVSWGVAGALDIALHAGDVILPEMITHASQIYVPNPDWRQRLHSRIQKNNFNVSSGTIAEVSNILISPGEKVKFHNTTGAVAADMESAAIAAVATSANIDYLAIRAISDDVTTRIPNAVLRYSNCYGRPVQPGFILEILRHPVQIKLLIRLARGFRAAINTLRLINNNIPDDLLYE
jgi:hopanoid-associated phosphorylase